MRRTPSTRREFLRLSGGAAGAAWLAAGAPLLRATAARAAEARRRGLPFEVLTEAEAREIEAMAARILPTTDTPGAREAGVIHFIDRALEGFMADALPVVRGAVEALNAAAAEEGAERFSDLPLEAQDRIVGALEKRERGAGDGEGGGEGGGRARGEAGQAGEAGEGVGGAPPHFGTVRFLTVAGMFSNPEHGGNREEVGWELLGFQDAPVWRPPFGWYDRDAHGPATGGGP